MTTSTLGSTSTLKSNFNPVNEIHLTAPDIRFFIDLIDEDLERVGDLHEDETVDFILETQTVFESALDNVIHDEEVLTISLNEEQTDYFFYDLVGVGAMVFLAESFLLELDLVLVFDSS